MSQATLSPLMQPREAQTLDWYVMVDTGSLAGQRFPIRPAGRLLTLGRDASCAIKFDPEQERVVGRRHAHIEIRSDGVYLVDDNSANGTFKEGKSVSEVRLQHGDRFQLGGEVEGAQGPWISIHLPVAVHVTPPASEGATLVTRINPQSRPAIPSAPLVPTHAAPELPAGFALQPIRQPIAPPPAYPPPAASLASPASAAPIAAEVVDPQQGRRRDQLIRQLASIVLLLILACAVGVAIGVRQDADQDAESDTRSK